MGIVHLIPYVETLFFKVRMLAGDLECHTAQSVFLRLGLPWRGTSAYGSEKRKKLKTFCMQTETAIYPSESSQRKNVHVSYEEGRM